MTFFENTFLCILFIWFLLSRKQQQKVRIYCWQYHIRKRLNRLTYDNLWYTFPCILFIWFLLSRKQQQKVRIYCWQYHIRKRLNRLTYDNLLKHVSMYIIYLFAFYSGTTIKKWEYVVDNIIFGIGLPD